MLYITIKPSPVNVVMEMDLHSHGCPQARPFRLASFLSMISDSLNTNEGRVFTKEIRH